MTYVEDRRIEAFRIYEDTDPSTKSIKYSIENYKTYKYFFEIKRLHIHYDGRVLIFHGDKSISYYEVSDSHKIVYYKTLPFHTYEDTITFYQKSTTGEFVYSIKKNMFYVIMVNKEDIRHKYLF